MRFDDFTHKHYIGEMIRFCHVKPCSQSFDELLCLSMLHYGVVENVVQARRYVSDQINQQQLLMTRSRIPVYVKQITELMIQTRRKIKEVT